jgi:hypothetical protein
MSRAGCRGYGSVIKSGVMSKAICVPLGAPPVPVIPVVPGVPISLWSQLRITSNGCWEWQGKRNGPGYGEVRQGDGSRIGAHRLIYLLTVGPLKDGDHVHHECRNRLCCNPSHLRAMSAGDHMFVTTVDYDRIDENLAAMAREQRERRRRLVRLSRARKATKALDTSAEP